LASLVCCLPLADDRLCACGQPCAGGGTDLQWEVRQSHYRCLLVVPVSPFDRRRENLAERPAGYEQSGIAHLRVRGSFAPQQMPSADTAHDERRGQIGGDDRMGEPIGKARVEDDRPPAWARHELAVGGDFMAGRRLHPAIGGENPEGGNECTDSDHHRRGEVQILADPVEAKQHDAEKTGFEKESRQHFVGHQRTDHGAGLVGEYRPVGAKLIGHDDAGHDAHAEDDGENLQPVFEQIEVELLSGPQPQAFEHGEIAGEADGERGKNEMEADREGELHPGKDHGIGCFEHGALPSTGLLAHGGRDIHPLPPDACLDYGMLRPR